MRAIIFKVAALLLFVSSTIGGLAQSKSNKVVKVGNLRFTMVFVEGGTFWEWCQDWYDSEYYTYSPSENPQGPDQGNEHVVRGGAWGVDADFCRITYRSFVESDNSSTVNLGFRLVLVP